MKKLKKAISLLLVTILSISVLAACSTDKGGEGTENSDTVKIGYVNWAEGVAMTKLAQVVLEDKMGYDVKATMADAGVIFTSIADGDYDIFMDTWLPVTHKDYFENYSDDLVDLGVNYESAKIGLVVPDYVDIGSIEELNDNKDEFEGKIVGIEPGAGLTESTIEAIKEYDLDYELLQGGEAVMTASLQEAIENKESIIVTGWTPHWKFGKWDLKFLEDPKGVYGDVETISTIGRKGIEKDLPEIAEFFKNFKLNEEQLSDLMAEINESDDEEATAREWMKENEDLVQSWIPEK